MTGSAISEELHAKMTRLKTSFRVSPRARATCLHTERRHPPSHPALKRPLIWTWPLRIKGRHFRCFLKIERPSCPGDEKGLLESWRSVNSRPLPLCSLSPRKSTHLHSCLPVENNISHFPPCFMSVDNEFVSAAGRASKI